MNTIDDSHLAWAGLLCRVCEPVLMNLAQGRLRERMPVETASGRREDRAGVTHLEAVGRTLAGIAPWLELTACGAGGVEADRVNALAEAARSGLAQAMEPASPDHLDFTVAGQVLVDAAFLALALLRAPAALWHPLPDVVKRRLIESMIATRRFIPHDCNWLLFSAMIETWLASVGEVWKRELVDNALVKHEQWYKGDGAYGDGPEFHWDYYNSYVIQPFMLEVVGRMGDHEARWGAMREAVLKRAKRYAAVQERMIGVDGTFPPIGRSIAYRCGAFHHLAMMALRHQLPGELKPAQVRGALAAVNARTLNAPDTFDDNGFLHIGLAGHQPALGEAYISTGSLYLCTFSFLPLGLPASDPFWADPPVDWTQRRIWAGEDLPADHHA